MEFKKRIHEGICAAKDCNKKQDLYKVPYRGREVDVCSEHALTVPHDEAVESAVVPAKRKKTVDVEEIDLQLLQAEEQEAKDALAELNGFEIGNEEDLEFAKGMVKSARQKCKELEAQRKQITDPINGSLRRIRDMFKPAIDGWTAMDVALSEMVSGYSKSLPSGKEDGGEWDFEVVDENLLPRLYLTANEKIIRAQVASGVREIPGVRIFQRSA